MAGASSSAMANKKNSLSDAFDLPPQKAKTPVPEERAVAFTEPAKQPAPKKASKLRRDGFDGARLNVYVPRELEERVRERAFKERRSVSDAVTEALERWLGSSARVQ